LGQTQQQFAQTLNTAITTIARYETGRSPQGWFLARLAEVAGQNNLTELATIFRGALVKELGSWDSTGYTLAIEPKDDVERLYVSAVLVVLRNSEFTRLIPQLNNVLAKVAKLSIEKLEWHKKNKELQRIVREMATAGKTPDEIASRIGLPVQEVRQFLGWDRFMEHLKVFKGGVAPD
jgi:transcriptional regulator with XRE-family HTH domain